MPATATSPRNRESPGFRAGSGLAIHRTQGYRDKRIAYAALGIPEYWRFDEDGRSHGVRLAGDRLLDGRYEPIRIDELPDGSLQGHCAVLNVNLRWTDGRLAWYDPATSEPVASLESERQARAQNARPASKPEARVRELEEQIRQLRGE